MLKKILCFILLAGVLISSSGCGLIGYALGAAASYGIYQATRK